MNRREKSIELLFVSKVRIKALEHFLLNPNDSIHLRGAVREFKEEINAVRRELMRLDEMGLITSEEKGNRKYFKLDLTHPFANELLGMLHKTKGIGAEIINNQNKLGQIEFAVLTPAFTKQVFYGDQIIDLAIVGNINMSVLEKIIKKHEEDSGKEMHYTILSHNEFKTRKRRKDDFIMNLMVQDVVMLIGKQEDMIRA